MGVEVKKKVVLSRKMKTEGDMVKIKSTVKINEFHFLGFST